MNEGLSFRGDNGVGGRSNYSSGDLSRLKGGNWIGGAFFRHYHSDSVQKSVLKRALTHGVVVS